jgi:hypothetical protein
MRVGAERLGAFHHAVLEVGSLPVVVLQNSTSAASTIQRFNQSRGDSRLDRFITEKWQRPLPGYEVNTSRLWGAHATRVLVSASRRNELS